STLPGLSGRKFTLLTVLWPSKRFAEEDLIPGGAASVAAAPAEIAMVQQKLEDMKSVFPDGAAAGKLDHAKGLVPQLPNSPEAQREFVELIRSLPHRQGGDQEDASNLYFSLPGDEVLGRLGGPQLPGGPPSPAGQGGAAVGSLGGPAAGGAAGGPGAA